MSRAKFTTAVIANDVGSIGAYTFLECSALTNIVYGGTSYSSKSAFQSAFGKTIGDNAFKDSGLSE